MVNDVITVVSGLPRSGTSLMMQMLAAGGLPPLVDDLRPPDENNPRGYFEFAPVKRLRTDRSWLEKARGHAVKVIHVLLRELPTDQPFSYRVILMKRPMEEILASQRAMLESQSKKSGDEKILAKVYGNQLPEIEEWLATQSCFQSVAVEYHRILEDPFTVAKEINEFLGRDLDVPAMAQAVDPSLCRQRLRRSTKFN